MHWIWLPSFALFQSENTVSGTALHQLTQLWIRGKIPVWGRGSTLYSCICTDLRLNICSFCVLLDLAFFCVVLNCDRCCYIYFLTCTESDCLRVYYVCWSLSEDAAARPATAATLMVACFCCWRFSGEGGMFLDCFKLKVSDTPF